MFFSRSFIFSTNVYDTVRIDIECNFDLWNTTTCRSNSC
ncbi:hypothetical protein EVA_11205 [gut metagenome]|uniref:Uncharacterized protein n=1 Tax=gut metagenome TaxID=749906 RepID=J9CKU9_9ZZZZ